MYQRYKELKASMSPLEFEKFKEEVVSRYQSSDQVTAAALAEEIGCCSNTITQWLSEAGVRARRGRPKGGGKAVSSEVLEKAEAAWNMRYQEDRVPYREVARRLGISTERARQLCLLWEEHSSH